MTIALSDNTPRISYTVSEGVTRTDPYPVPFVFFTKSTDLNVFVDGVERTFDATTANTTQYTVTGGDGSTGTVTTTVTGATGGSTVVITRSIPLERTTDFPSSGAFEVSKLNTELDTLLTMITDADDENSRALRLQDSDEAVSLTLPLKADRLGTVLGFNATTGAAEAGPTIANVNSLSAITANINTVAGISANVTTVAGISSNVTTVAGISSNVTTVAGISSDITSVAGDASDIGTVATDIANVNSVGSNISNVNAVAGNSSNINTVAGANTNITTVASNITGVNSFAERYRVDSSDPSTSLDEGDLFFNTTDNTLKYYNGSAWEGIIADTDVKTKVSTNDTTAGFLNGKLVAGSNISFTENNDGGNETLTIASTAEDPTALAIALG